MSPLLEQVTIEVLYPDQVRFRVMEALKLYHPYHMGTFPGYFVRMTRDRADLMITHLNLIEGVKARIYGE